jgi:hypothetical protein
MLPMNLTLARTALPPTTRLAMPGRKLAPQIYADLNSVGGRLNFHYQLSDAAGAWYLTVRDLQGRQYRRERLSPSGHSVTLSQSDFPRSLYLLEVQACGGKDCRSVYRQRLMLGGF